MKYLPISDIQRFHIRQILVRRKKKTPKVTKRKDGFHPLIIYIIFLKKKTQKSLSISFTSPENMVWIVTPKASVPSLKKTTTFLHVNRAARGEIIPVFHVQCPKPQATTDFVKP